MVYSKQTWADGSSGGTPINAARLGVMEQGILDAHALPSRAGIFNVKDKYGAIGDGVANDSVAFSNALADIKTNGGGTLYIPPGTYLVAGGAYPLYVCNNLTVIGWGATLKKYDQAFGAMFVGLGGPGYGTAAKNVRFFGIRFQGDFVNHKMMCPFAMHHVQGLEVAYCILDQCQGPRHSFDLNGCKDIWIHHNKMIGFYDDSAASDSPAAECIQIDYSYNGALSYSDAAGKYDGLVTKDVLIHDNEFLPITVGGVTYPCPNPLGNHGYAQGQYCSNIRFVRNYVLDPGAMPATTMGDNQSLNLGVIHMASVRDVDISDNVFVQTKNRVARVIAIASTSYVTKTTFDANLGPPADDSDKMYVSPPQQSSHIRITGNRFEGFKPASTADNTQECIWLRGMTGAPIENVHVTGNTFRNLFLSGQTGVWAVYIENGDSCWVSENQFDGINYGVRFGSVVQGSISRNTYSAINGNPAYLVSSDNVGVRDNSVVGYLLPMQSDGNCDDISFMGNTFTGQLAAADSNNGNGIVCAGSIRALITNNVITNSTANTYPRGVAVLNSAGKYNLVANNVIRGFTVPVDPATAPANTTYVNNLS